MAEFLPHVRIAALEPAVLEADRGAQGVISFTGSQAGRLRCTPDARALWRMGSAEVFATRAIAEGAA